MTTFSDAERIATLYFEARDAFKAAILDVSANHAPIPAEFVNTRLMLSELVDAPLA